ncbi:hypothetical protein JM47_02165 [Ureaplasma diversum]|uniref:UmuC domain-containing protein n=1 Tax=Ureaplasma diversum TaxID=42094 RepID=A0A0C5RPU1_9BACT|nr:DNA polymerase IV [Ureaplasma diversum]AJQ45384.1 hypothetical protein JM47_02165 [Ureaplasma diversum]
MNKIFFHIDIDAFFASVAEIVFPKYKNQPLAVGSLNSRTGIISSPNYIARSFGVKAAMPSFLAMKLCPKLIIVEHTGWAYERYSKQFFSIIKSYTNNCEIASIDECFIDVTDLLKDHHNNPKLLAIKIQKHIYNSLDLKVSIGIAKSKLLAKMATELAKLNGIFILDTDDIKPIMYNKEVATIPYIGPKTASLLYKQNIKTIKDLVNEQNQSIVQDILGASYYSTINPFLAHHENNDLTVNRVAKSIGRSTTLAFDSNDEATIVKELKILIKDTIKRLKKAHLWTNNISLTIKYADFKTKTKTQNLRFFSNDYDVIANKILKLFRNWYDGEWVRLIGISLNNLIDESLVNEQFLLFD